MPNEPHSDERLTLSIDWPEITLDGLSRVTSLWRTVIQAVSQKVVGRKSAIKWVLTSVHFGSPLDVEVLASPTTDRVEPALLRNISHSVVSGFQHLEQYSDQPEFFSKQALGAARKLALLTDTEKDRRITVSNGVSEPVEVSLRTVITVDGIFGPVEESYGTVEGTLEGVFTHGRRRFYVYDSLAGKQVRCTFDDRIPLTDVLKNFEKRVSVSGLIRSKALTAERVSIQATEFSAFLPDKELPSLYQILHMWRQR